MTDMLTIEFPCDYPIKIIGLGEDGFAARMLGIVQRHAPEVEGFRMRARESRNGKYLSITVSIWASGEAQLRDLHRDLISDPDVKMVL
ncbi:MAG: DUF493 domain-containing protein [Pseudomonadales bacterium]|jgi:hypothetical protein|nr:DUF493 domain-containing protein [Pseudomonadales bacterium]MDP6472648.1 DUF493 domain-containing protein [Pseudomonadales bacterium]MDP6829074.1 DUF493 domain-containing protein [Pseudomonadales bacterium]MDP6971382.1 DUF493 domain-containing protein [Pseudomonadales bacterium]|tara:strand:+ start:1145 stop:1408 length:264 start_codon:yes stop_codon:yes gene_type:complete